MIFHIAQGYLRHFTTFVEIVVNGYVSDTCSCGKMMLLTHCSNQVHIWWLTLWKGNSPRRASNRICWNYYASVRFNGKETLSPVSLVFILVSAFKWRILAKYEPNTIQCFPIFSRRSILDFVTARSWGNVDSRRQRSSGVLLVSYWWNMKLLRFLHPKNVLWSWSKVHHPPKNVCILTPMNFKQRTRYILRGRWNIRTCQSCQWIHLIILILKRMSQQ